MLFTYKNCGCCKREMTNVKVLLNNIFPVGICDGICDYNLYCSKCKDLYDKERRYIYRYKQLTKPELQINFFQTQMPTPIYLSNNSRVNLRTFRKEIDNVLDTDSCKEQFKKNKLFLSAVKSYIKKEWKYTHHIMEKFHDLEDMKFYRQLRVWWFPNGERSYMFRNKEYKIKHLWEVFFKEYLKQLFKGYENYLNLTEIEERLQKVINT